MTARVGLASLLGLALTLAVARADAQSVGVDEVVTSPGVLTPAAGFTSAQKNAIYSAIVRRRARASAPGIEPTVGASVPHWATLAELPRQTGLADATLLKYATVADDVVVVDPIGMHIVDIIQSATGP